MLLRQLHKMAQKDGGAVYMLNGNHESLNVCGDYRSVACTARNNKTSLIARWMHVCIYPLACHSLCLLTMHVRGH